MSREQQSGFTIAELLIALAMLLGASILALSQWQYAETRERDSDRKTAINALHYYLEEVYKPANNGSYPAVLDAEAIEALQPDELRDPLGRIVTDPASDLRYEPGGCNGDLCGRYTLRADLEKESDFIRQSNSNS